MRHKKLLLLLLIFPLLTALSTPNEDGKYEVEACDGETAVLECPPSLSIFNITANYGRMSINSCNSANAEYPTNCLNFEQTKAILEKQCLGSSSCSVVATVSTFGMPRAGEEKCVYREGAFFLSVIYHCQSTTPPATTTVAIEDVSIDTIDEEKEEEKIVPTTPRVTGRCLSTRSHGIVWRETKGGSRAISTCPNGGVGNATWSCHSDGVWSTDGPSFTQCASREIEEALDEIKSAKKLKLNTALDKTMSRMLTSVSEKSEMGKDLTLILDFVHEITPILSSQSTMVGEKKKEEYRQMSLDIVGEMMDSPSAWESGWSEDEKKGLASRYLYSIETILLSTDKQKFYSHETTKPLIAGEIGVVTGRGEGGVRIPSMNIGDSAILPSEMFTPHNSISMLFSSTRNIAKYLPPVTRPFSSVSSRIVSNIVTISHVFDHQVKKVHLSKDKITVVFDHPSSLDGFINPQCVWWDTKSRVGGGDWSTLGCSLLSHDEKSTKCQCDHLTHFALLMDVADIELSPFDYTLLTLLTRIGCGISIVCLILSFFCFTIFTRNGGDRVFIHKNLCVTLAFAQSLFLFTISWTDNQMVCRGVSSLLLYFFLSSLLWMLVEGVQLYFLLVDVFSSHSRRLKFFLFCFGLPLLIVGLANYFEGENMITKDHCWLSSGSYVLLFSFVIPCLVVVLFNTFFLCMAVYITVRRTSNGYMPCKVASDVNHCQWIKGSFALMALLGVTWSVGGLFLFFSSLSTISIYIAYTFTVVNSLQGLFIFLFHVVFNQKMRSDISDWSTRRGCLCLSSTSSNDSTTRRTANAFSPSNDSTALFIGGECSDSWLPPRGNGRVEMYGERHGYPSHEDMIRHHMYHHGGTGGGGGGEYGGGNYDYATIAYGDMVLPGRGQGMGGAYGTRSPSSHMGYAPPPYLRYGMIPPIDTLPSSVYGGSGVTRLHHPRLPPPQGMPPLPPSSSPPSLQSSRVSPPSSTHRGVSSLPFRRPPSSDDSAYSDSSSMLQSEVTVDGSTVLRMNLGRNTSLIQQDL